MTTQFLKDRLAAHLNFFDRVLVYETFSTRLGAWAMPTSPSSFFVKVMVMMKPRWSAGSLSVLFVRSQAS